MIQWQTGNKHWKYDARFTFNEESDYSEENTSDNEDFRSTIFNHFSLSLNRKKRVEMRAMEKKQNIFTLQLPILLHIRIGNLNCCKCGNCKNEAREKDCLCCREIQVYAMVINLAKTPQCEGNNSPPVLMSYCPTISHTC